VCERQQGLRLIGGIALAVALGSTDKRADKVTAREHGERKLPAQLRIWKWLQIDWLIPRPKRDDARIVFTDRRTLTIGGVSARGRPIANQDRCAALFSESSGEIWLRSARRLQECSLLSGCKHHTRFLDPPSSRLRFFG
jgi:hypothetical protein